MLIKIDKHMRDGDADNYAFLEVRHSNFIFLKFKGGGYGTNFYFHYFRAPFATTHSFFIQIHLTKFHLVFWPIYKQFHKKSFFISQYFFQNSKRRCQKTFRHPGIPPIWNITEKTFFVMLINGPKYQMNLSQVNLDENECVVAKGARKQ